METAVFNTVETVPQRQRFARFVALGGDTELTEWRYEQSLRRVEQFLGKSILEVKSGDLQRFLSDSDYHDSAKSLCLIALRVWLDFLLLEQVLDASRGYAISATERAQNL